MDKYWVTNHARDRWAQRFAYWNNKVIEDVVVKSVQSTNAIRAAVMEASVTYSDKKYHVRVCDEVPNVGFICSYEPTRIVVITVVNIVSSIRVRNNHGKSIKNQRRRNKK